MNNYMGNYMKIICSTKKHNDYEALYHHGPGSGRNPDCLQF